MSVLVIKGIYPVLPTPFLEDGSVDEDSFRRVIRYVLKAGAHGVVFPAMASEFYSLSEKERKSFTEILVEEVNHQIPVVVGVTAPSTEVALDLVAHANRSGADAVMAMAQNFMKSNFREIQRYYQEISSLTQLPVILQNAPDPAGCGLTVEKVVRILQDNENISYVKEENLPCGQRMTNVLESSVQTLKGVFGGAGGRFIMDELARGAIGNMPACELTEAHVAIYEKYKNDDFIGARHIYNRILPLLTCQSVFRTGVTKAVLHKRGIISSETIRVGCIPFDNCDRRELDTLLNEINDLLEGPFERFSETRS